MYDCILFSTTNQFHTLGKVRIVLILFFLFVQRILQTKDLVLIIFFVVNLVLCS